MAPTTGDVMTDLVGEAAEYLGLTADQVIERSKNAAQQFKQEWQQRVADPTDERAVTRFYNESESELFELIPWHASDPIHYRTLICVDMARRRTGRRFLDYGSGIGSDAIVFAEAGFEVTLADVSERLLEFARWRCESRGYKVHVVDLKHREVARSSCDVAVCFDVLEHIPKPMRTLGRISRALTPGALLFVHAPFGVDVDRPMHVVHADDISSRMRTVGFNWRGDLKEDFPSWLWSPHVYERFELSKLDELGYYVHDVLMPGPIGDLLAAVYRHLVPRRNASSA
jgi:2-polyprenyl-3-methyl-5-hydroxy-6-metoxy-1,4-benzoquinol methylase